MSNGTDLIHLDATDVVAKLNAGEVSPLEVLDAVEARVAAVDGLVNALPTLCFERARARVADLMVQPLGARGVLAGLPVAIKDLNDVKGVRTSMGSRVFDGYVATANSFQVDRLETSGGVVYAKSNSPEFGAGANTFNDVFGATLNPWDRKKSCAGSSGGAAVALATGMAWMAQGSDTGGSLRTPASFCGIVGMRPSPGRIASGPALTPVSSLALNGPMARNVADMALMFDAMVGVDTRDPNSQASPDGPFLAAALAPELPKRLAVSRDLGITPVDPQVVAVFDAAVDKLAAAGVEIVETQPDFSGVMEVFYTYRALQFATSMAPLLKDYRNVIKPEIVKNIEKGLALSVDDLMRAERERAAIYGRVTEFFTEFPLIVTPTAIVPPFPVEQRWVTECNGVPFENYIDWLAIVSAFTTVSSPALSLNCGFTPAGLPIGMQVAGPRLSEASILRAAAGFEQVFGLRGATPVAIA